MSTYTNWYHLDKYEGQDKPNLLDQYNSAMDKVDSALHQIAESGGGGVPADIEQRLVTLEGEVDNLQIPNVDLYQGKNIVFIGDSYTFGTGASDHSTTNQKRYSSLLATYLNMQEYNFAVGGTGFCYGGSSNKTFNQQIIDAAGNMTSDAKNNTYLVIIAGGINDARQSTYSYSQEYNAVNTCINTAVATFPNANILIVPMLYQGFQFTPIARNLYTAIVNATQKSNKKNVLTMEGCYTWNWGDRNHFANDKLHPNDLGHETIAKHVLHGVFGELSQWEDYEYSIQFETGFEPGAADVLSESTCKVYIQRGIVYLPPFRVRAQNAITTNTIFGHVPKSCSPADNAYLQMNQGDAIRGCGAIAFNANLYINPHLREGGTTSPDQFFVSGTSYPLFGQDYQN